MAAKAPKKGRKRASTSKGGKAASSSSEDDVELSPELHESLKAVSELLGEVETNLSETDASVKTLDETYRNAHQQINDIFNKVIYQLSAQKRAMLQQLTETKQKKETALTAESKYLKSQQIMLAKQKKHFEYFIKFGGDSKASQSSIESYSKKKNARPRGGSDLGSLTRSEQIVERSTMLVSQYNKRMLDQSAPKNITTFLLNPKIKFYFDARYAANLLKHLCYINDYTPRGTPPILNFQRGATDAIILHISEAERKKDILPAGLVTPMPGAADQGKDAKGKSPFDVALSGGATPSLASKDDNKVEMDEDYFLVPKFFQLQYIKCPPNQDIQSMMDKQQEEKKSTEADDETILRKIAELSGKRSDELGRLDWQSSKLTKLSDLQSVLAKQNAWQLQQNDIIEQWKIKEFQLHELSPMSIYAIRVRFQSKLSQWTHFSNIILGATGNNISLFVKPLSGRMLRIDCQVTTTIAELKQLVVDEMCKGTEAAGKGAALVQVKDLKLMSGGKSLADDATLESFGIGHDQTVNCVVRPPKE